MTTRNTLFRSLATAAALTCLGSAVAFAGTPNPNTDLKGTYSLVNFDSSPESDALTLTFNGAGSFMGADINNSLGVISSKSVSGTYNVASNGTFTVVTDDSGGDFTGIMSTDRNVIMVTTVTSDQTPAILVGIKQGAIANLNSASGLLALNSNTTGSSNSAMGFSSLTSNSTGANNTAFGANAVLLAPVELVNMESYPDAVLLDPLILPCIAETPVAELELPVVLLIRAESPTAAL